MGGFVVALIGLPGAGKSTLARCLQPHFDLHVVNRDAIRAAMFPDCRFTSAEKIAAVSAAMDAVAVNCSSGRNSIVDGMTLATAAARERLAAVCAEAGYRLIPVWLDCPVSVACRRVRNGRHPAADRDGDLVKRVAERFDRPAADVIRVDATEPVSVVCAQAAAALRTATATVPA